MLEPLIGKARALPRLIISFVMNRVPNRGIFYVKLVLRVYIVTHKCYNLDFTDPIVQNGRFKKF